MRELLIPPSLAVGDTVGVIAPAGMLVDQQRYRQGCEILKSLGFMLHEPEKPWPGYGYLADTDAERAAELHKVWADPQVKAIITLRGGFGSARLLHHLDLDLIRRQPKLLVGFSDISLLVNYLHQRCGLLCLHGPTLTTLPICNSSTLERLRACLMGGWRRSLNEDVEIVRAGQPAKGLLLAGNLSCLVSLLGTPYQIDCSGVILVLEDVNEPPYRIDRCLTQLAQSGQLSKAAGIILGQFSDAADDDRLARLRRHEFVWNRVAELTAEADMPIWGNFPVGHDRHNLCLPIGAPVVMDSGKQLLAVLDRAI